MNNNIHSDKTNQSFREKMNMEIIKAKENQDLIIEENTIYEIDRDCYERLKRQKKRKAPTNKIV